MQQLRTKITGARNIILGMAIMALVFTAVLTVSAQARTRQATLNFNDIRITLDGAEIIPVDAQGNAVEPFIIDGVTYLPVRGIANALGLGVDWDGDTNTVILTSPAQQGAAMPAGQGALIHEDENVRITFAGTRIGGTSLSPREEIEFFVENRTAARLTFQSDSMAIDGHSLGHVSGSDSIAPQSSGIVRFRTAEAFPTMSPSTVSGSIIVIDFDRVLTADQISHRVAEITFVNVSVR